ncbi:MAG: GBS Bsp-like repeat-containing protein [Suipraeoptans sp.]
MDAKGKRRYREKIRAKREREIEKSTNKYQEALSEKEMSPEIKGALFATGIIELPDEEVPFTSAEEEEKTKWKLEKRPFFVILTILMTLLATISVFIFMTVRWVFNTWTNLSMKELTFTIQSNIDGTNTDMIKDFIISTIPYAIGIAVVVALILVIIRLKKVRILYNVLARVGVLVLAITLTLVSVRTFWNNLDMQTYTATASQTSEFIEHHYIEPSETAVTFPEEKRNLIYIYLESVETTFADSKNGGAFDENVIPELTEISQSNENFSGQSQELNGAYALEGGTWTVAAMFSQTSGLPLLIPIERNSMDKVDEFFPGITSLGDILSAADYNQYLLVGSDASFGGRKNYFTSHGDYEMYDYYYAKSENYIPEDYKVWWGYEDARLFEIAKDKILEASKEDEPFNFTMLTVDTHFEEGWRCDDCIEEFDESYSDVYACSSRKVEDLLEWIKKQDFYENTTIVIAGDHLTMDSDYCDDVSEDYNRKVYTSFVNSAVTPKRDDRREYSTLDMFPTTLAALGATIQGDKLGLGVNLFSDRMTLVEEFGVEELNSEFLKQSDFMDKLTSTIRDEYQVVVDAQEEEVDMLKLLEESVVVTKGPYDYRNACFDISIDNVPDDFNPQSVQVAMWSKEDQSDLRWYDCSPMEDGTYQTRVYSSDFGNVSGIYTIHIYFIDEMGETYISTQLEATL